MLYTSVSIYQISDYNPWLWYPAVTLPNWWCYLVPSLQGHQPEPGHLLNRSQGISFVLNVTLQWNVTKTCRCGRRSELFGRFAMHLCLLPTKLHRWHVVIPKKYPCAPRWSRAERRLDVPTCKGTELTWKNISTCHLVLVTRRKIFATCCKPDVEWPDLMEETDSVCSLQMFTVQAKHLKLKLPQTWQIDRGAAGTHQIRT